MTPAQRFLTVKETAQRLGVHPNTVRAWVKTGVLRSSRPAGTRDHRFDEREVLRLEESRGAAAAAAGVTIRRAPHAGVNVGDELRLWADEPSARTELPLLIRKLLVCTPGITDLHMRTGRGVDIGGWDGTATSVGTTYLPAGRLLIELSTEADPKSKANREFAKRAASVTAESGEKGAIFCFITPRRFAGAQNWAHSKRRLGVFGDVKVLDCDDIDGWLDQHEVVRRWFLEHRGIASDDVCTLDYWFGRFVSRTTRPIPGDLLLAGRDRESADLFAALGSARRQDRHVAVMTPWADEALGFVCATLLKAGTDLSTALLVKSSSAWHRVCASPSPLVLVPHFVDPRESPDIPSALDAGHAVVELVDSGSSSTDSLRLSRIQVPIATMALETAGYPHVRAADLAKCARRSFRAFVRVEARSKAHQNSPWASEPQDASVLAAALLAGEWTLRDADTSIVAELAGEPWQKVERVLRYWAMTDDPPFVASEGAWRAAVAEDAAIQLQGSFSDQLLSTFAGVLIRTLTDIERESFEGRAGALRPSATARQGVSSILVGGLTQGLALLSITGDVSTSSPHRQRFVRSTFERLMARVCSDQSGTLLVNIAPYMGLLAEAEPDGFLQFIEDQIIDGTLLYKLLDEGDASPVGRGSPHCSLLWALESLAWSEQYFDRSVKCLAGLANIDPGGRIANRPQASLRNILMPWANHTNASNPSRRVALEKISVRYPSVAWTLVMDLWPMTHTTSFPPEQPTLRDWRSEERPVTMSDLYARLQTITDQAIELAGTDAKRWAELIGRAHAVPPDLERRIIDGFEAFVREPLQRTDQEQLWQVLRDIVAEHRTYAHAEWAMSKASRERLSGLANLLEPRSGTGHLAYLFSLHVIVGGDELTQDPGTGGNWNERAEKVREARAEAADRIASAPESDISDLAEKVEVPQLLGSALGELDGSKTDRLEKLMLNWLGPSTEEGQANAKLLVAVAWATRVAERRGPTWASRVLDSESLPPGQRDTARRNFVLALPARPEFWELFDGNDDLTEVYWSGVSRNLLAADHAELSVPHLLDVGRAWTAMHLIAVAAHHIAGGPAVAGGEESEHALIMLACKVIDAALKPTDRREKPSGDVGHEVSVVLDLVDRHLSHAVMAQYEFFFYPVLEHARHPHQLHRHLAENPTAFVQLARAIYRRDDSAHQERDNDRDVGLDIGEFFGLPDQGWSIPINFGVIWSILSGFNRIPGSDNEGAIDELVLRKWIREARRAFAEVGRETVGDELIGQLLGSTRAGQKHELPAEAVRNVIEDIGNLRMATGFQIARFNSVGLTERGLYEGGEQEHRLAQHYHRMAEELTPGWPRTGRMLRSIGEDFLREAEHQDQSVRLRSDGF